jgi:uncharacterized protein
MPSPNTAQDVPRSVRNRTPLAFLSAIPIAILGGLIGLGGAEFRLPVLAGSLGYSARKAIPLNLAVSLATIIASLLIRGRCADSNATMSSSHGTAVTAVRSR